MFTGYRTPSYAGMLSRLERALVGGGGHEKAPYFPEVGNLNGSNADMCSEPSISSSCPGDLFEPPYQL